MLILFQIQVAVKSLSQEHVRNNPEEFLKEASLMHSIDNEYIVRFYGLVLESDAMMLVKNNFFYSIPQHSNNL